MGVSSGLWLRERELRRMDKLCQGQVNLCDFFIQLFLHKVFKLATEHLYTINVYTSTKMAWLDLSVCNIFLTPSPSHHHPHTSYHICTSHCPQENQFVSIL